MGTQGVVERVVHPPRINHSLSWRHASKGESDGATHERQGLVAGMLRARVVRAAQMLALLLGVVLAGTASVRPL